jgi:ABC-type branched-subunit amino acid transport system substrate-binding protein
MKDHRVTRRTAIKAIGATLLGTAVGIGAPRIVKAQDKIKIGFLTAFTGLETILGETQFNCFKLAVDEINAQGGAGGRQIEYVSEDDQTTTQGTIQKVRKVLGQDKVDVVLGLITSLERKAALSVTEPAKKLLIYPTYYEGAECRKYLICTGQVPNQSVDPYVPWLSKNVGKSVYIIGSDYVWPRITAKAIKDAFDRIGGKVVGTEFFPFGTQDFGPVLDKVRAANPDIFWTMLAGADAVTGLKQIRSFGLKSQLATNGLDELFTTAVPAGEAAGMLDDQSWFDTLDNPKSKQFLAAYRAKYGQDKLINSIGEATYDATWLYAKAVAKAGSIDDDKVIKAFSEVEFEAPQGLVRVLARNNHMVSASILGRCRNDGLFDIVENFGMIDPEIAGCNLS